MMNAIVRILFEYTPQILHCQCPDVAFSPTIPTNNSDTKKIRAAVTGSLNSTIPTMTAPRAPIPVQTA